MIQKHRVHRFPHCIISSKRKRNIRNSTAHRHIWKILANPPCRFYKINCISPMFLHSRSHRENIKVKNNILWRETYLVHQNFIRALCNLYSSLVIIRLAHFIESHYNNRRAVSFYNFRLANKLLFSFF